MKVNTFQELITRINNLSTRNKKPIQTTWSGTTAYTNLEVVNLPALPAGTILTPNQFSIWLGYDIHEGPGHQVHTDLELYQETCKIRNSPQFSYILNLLEDIRIENADIALYPGDRKYLDSVHHFVDQKIPPQLAKSPDIMGLIYKQLFTHHRNLDTNIISGTLDPETSLLISEIDFCQSTQDCITLADKIVAYLKQKKEDQNQNSPNSEGASASEPGSSNPEPSNPKNNENKSENGENNDGESKNSSNDTSGNGNAFSNSGDLSTRPNHRDQSNNQNFNFSDQSTNFWQEITEIKNIIQELKNQNLDPNHKSQITNNQIPNQDLENESIFPPFNISWDRIYVPSSEDYGTYFQTRTSCSSQILALKKMFRIYLQAQTKKSTIRGLEEGKLDSQRLFLPATGSNLIFKDQSTKFLPETAIELMIDMSGSMNANLARTSAIILAEALSSIPQIKLSISGFTTNRNSNNQFGFNIPPNSGRQVGMDILQFKDFSEPYSKCKSKLGAITNSGNTPLGDAYGKALEHIIQRPENRKIIFLITDGNPEFPQGKNHSDYLLMKKIHKTAKRFKIQTLGLGIDNCEFLSNYFDQSINITKITDLPQNLLKALKLFI